MGHSCEVAKNSYATCRLKLLSQWMVTIAVGFPHLCYVQEMQRLGSSMGELSRAAGAEGCEVGNGQGGLALGCLGLKGKIQAWRGISRGETAKTTRKCFHGWVQTNDLHLPRETQIVPMRLQGLLTPTEASSCHAQRLPTQPAQARKLADLYSWCWAGSVTAGSTFPPPHSRRKICLVQLPATPSSPRCTRSTLPACRPGNGTRAQVLCSPAPSPSCAHWEM